MAMVQDTATVLLDEPTTYLDIRNQLDTMERARALAERGKAVVMVLHDFEAALRYADRVYLLSEGRVRAEGTPEAVLPSAELEAAFGVTVRLYREGDGPHCYVTAAERSG